MKNITNLIIVLITVFALFLSCKPSSSFYYKNRLVNVGQLNDSTLSLVNQFLIHSSGQKPKDTIIITYNFNENACWSRLDASNDDYINGFVDRRNARINNKLKTREHISIYSFRESGNKVNKIISYNDSIKIDDSNMLLELFFERRFECGSTLTIMPDKRFVMVYNDSHLEILDFTKTQYQEILNNLGS